MGFGGSELGLLGHRDRISCVAGWLSSVVRECGETLGSTGRYKPDGRDASALEAEYEEGQNAGRGGDVLSGC